MAAPGAVGPGRAYPYLPGFLGGQGHYLINSPTFSTIGFGVA